MSKKAVAMVLSLVLAVSLLTACEADPAEMIARGDQYVEAKDYESAITYYEKAGEEGLEKLKEVYLTMAKNRLWADDFGKAMEFLTTQAANYVTQEEAAQLLLSHLKQTMEEEKEFRLPIIEEAEQKLWDERKGITDLDYSERREIREEWDDNINWYQEKLVSLMEDAAAVIPEGTPGLQEVLDEGYNIAGDLMLRKESTFNTEYISWINIVPYWEECSQGKGYEITQALNLLKEKKYQQGLEALEGKFENPGVLDSLLKEFLGDFKANNFTDYFSYCLATRTANSNPNALVSLEETQYVGGKSRQDTDYVLTEDLLQELYDGCGKNPEGKILILNEHSLDGTVSVYTLGMDQLPDSCYPENLESVEYVIYISHKTVETGGMFGSTTKELRRDGIITIYDVKTGEAIWTQTKEGPTDFMMTYYGDKPPATYCAGDPTVSLTNAFAEIAKHLK